MRLALFLLFNFMLTLTVQFEPIACFDIAHVTLQNSGVMTSGNQYSFPVTWTSTLSEVSQSALALRGYKIQQDDCYLSFQASISTVTTSGTTITITPLQAHTYLLSLEYEVLMISSCGSGKMELLTADLTPTTLSQSSRATIDEETFSIGSSTFDLTDSTDFYVSAFLVDFTVSRAANKVQEVRVQNITVSAPNINITLYSLHTYANSITAVGITVLVVKKSAYNPSIVYYNYEYDAYCHNCVNNHTIDIGTINSDSCIVPLDKFRASNPTFTPKGISNTFEQNVVQYTAWSLSWAVFNISCYLQCGDGSYFDYVNNVSTCVTCPTECATCLNSTYCMSCASAYYIDANTCKSCGTGCLSCNSLTSCTSCQSISALSGGVCANCSSTSGFYFSNNICYSCHSSCAQCQGAPNNCSTCNTGYTLDSSTSTCLPAPNQIIDCLHTTHVTLQQSSSNMTTPNSYTYHIAWASTIDNIASSALALAGFEVGPAFGYLSYHASLTNVSSSGATIIITPNKTGSNIVLLQFDVIVTTSCGSDKISLYSTVYYPTVLSDSSRSADSQNALLDSPTFDLTDSSNYFISVYLSDFIMFVPGTNYQRIGIDTAITIVNGKISLILYSHVDYSNTVTSVTFTVVIVRKNAYTHPFFEYKLFYDAVCVGTGCTGTATLTSPNITPSEISASKCLISMYNLRTQFVNEPIRKVFMTINSDNTADSQSDQISWAQFNISCFLTCQSGYYYDGTYQAGVCRMCPLQCPTCINTTACCLDGYVYVSSSASCQTCASNQYISSNTCVTCPDGCSTCTSSSSCSTCSDGYELNSAACTRVGSSQESSSAGTIIAVSVVMVLLITAAVLFLIWLFGTAGGEACRKKLCPQVEEAQKSPGKQSTMMKSTIYAGKQPTIQAILAFDECAICLNQQLDSKSACGHHFHLQCLREWSSKLMSCPVCRSKELGPVDVFCKQCKRYMQTVDLDMKDEQLNRCTCLENSDADIKSNKKLNQNEQEAV